MCIFLCTYYGTVNAAIDRNRKTEYLVFLLLQIQDCTSLSIHAKEEHHSKNHRLYLWCPTREGLYGGWFLSWMKRLHRFLLNINTSANTYQFLEKWIQDRHDTQFTLVTGFCSEGLSIFIRTHVGLEKNRYISAVSCTRHFILTVENKTMICIDLYRPIQSVSAISVTSIDDMYQQYIQPKL